MQLILSLIVIVSSIAHQYLTMRQVGSYVLDFPDPASKLSVKNVQLVLADDDGPRHIHESIRRTFRRTNGCGGEGMRAEREHQPGRKDDVMGRHLSGNGETMLSLAKLDPDDFALDFRWPLTPMQAFGIALAALDTSI